MTAAPSFDPSTIPEEARARFLALSDEGQREHLADFVDSGDLPSAFTYAKLNPPRFQEIISRLGNPRSGTRLDDALFKILDSANNNAVEAVVQEFDVDPRGTVLELGFGGGYGIELAADRGWMVSGVEYSPAMVEAASTGRARRAIEAGKASLRQGDALNLPFDDHSFDAVYHVNCFYFWSDLARGVSECFRVLRPGGLMVTGSKLGLLKRRLAKIGVEEPAEILPALLFGDRFEIVRIRELRHEVARTRIDPAVDEAAQ